MFDFQDDHDYVFLLAPCVYVFFIFAVYFFHTRAWDGFGTLKHVRHQFQFQRTLFWKIATAIGMSIPLASLFGLYFSLGVSVLGFQIIVTAIYIVFFWYEVFYTPKSIFYLTEDCDHICVQIEWFMTIDTIMISVEKSLLEYYLPLDGPEYAIAKDDLETLSKHVTPKISARMTLL